jgi:hypothetical protein
VAEVWLEQVRRLCLSLPEVVERPSHGRPAFFVQGKWGFVNYMDNHHDDGRLALWCAAPWGMQQALVQNRPEAYFVPPYVGHRGWVGVRLDMELGLEEIREAVITAYRQVAPKRLLAQLDKPIQ